MNNLVSNLSLVVAIMVERRTVKVSHFTWYSARFYLASATTLFSGDDSGSCFPVQDYQRHRDTFESKLLTELSQNYRS